MSIDPDLDGSGQVGLSVAIGDARRWGDDLNLQLAIYEYSTRMLRYF